MLPIAQLGHRWRRTQKFLLSVSCGAVHDVAWMECRLRCVQFGQSRQQGNNGGVTAMQLRFTSNSTAWASVAEDSKVFVICVLLDSRRCGWGDVFF